VQQESSLYLFYPEILVSLIPAAYASSYEELYQFKKLKKTVKQSRQMVHSMPK
jgi:hypothetical protein